MEQKNFLFISFFLCMLFLPFSSALGIAPGKVMLDFSPAAVVEREIALFNTEERVLHLLLEARGELAPYLTLSASEIILQPGESKIVPYTLRLPDQFARSGIYGGMIVARPRDSQLSPGSNLAPRIGGVASVGSVIQVHVPYGGRSVQAEVFIPRTKPFAPVEFLTHVTNVGTEALRALQVEIAIYDTENQLVTILKSDKRPLEEQRRTTFVSVWEPAILYGEYRAVVTFSYDGREQELATDFIVGESVVDMVDVHIEDFTFGSAATIAVTLQNTGDVALPVEGRLQLADEQRDYHVDLEQQTFELQPQSSGAFRYRWSLLQRPLGRYVGKALFQVQGLRIQRNFHILLTEEGISAAFTPLNALTGRSVTLEPTADTGSSLSLVILVAAILLFLNVLFLIMYRRRKREVVETAEKP